MPSASLACRWRFLWFGRFAFLFTLSVFQSRATKRCAAQIALTGFASSIAKSSEEGNKKCSCVRSALILIKTAFFNGYFRV